MDIGRNGKMRAGAETRATGRRTAYGPHPGRGRHGATRPLLAPRRPLRGRIRLLTLARGSVRVGQVATSGTWRPRGVGLSFPRRRGVDPRTPGDVPRTLGVDPPHVRQRPPHVWGRSPASHVSLLWTRCQEVSHERTRRGSRGSPEGADVGASVATAHCRRLGYGEGSRILA